MAKCKCGSRPRIVSSMVQAMDCDKGHCWDICKNPICGDPDKLSLFAPLIYDEIGVNLCTTFEAGVDIPATYPGVTNARVRVIDVTYTYGDDNVRLEAITGRTSCYRITLANLTVRFAVELFDASCRLVATIYPTAVYLPSDITAPTYDEDTNPTAVELDLFAPYGFTYDTTADTPTPAINAVGATTENNMLRQGINLYAIGKLLDLDTEQSTLTVGLTVVLQSLYFAGYKVGSCGKIDIPKGSIIAPDNSQCMRFVAGELLNLAIKPLDLGVPEYEEELKIECDSQPCGCNCQKNCDTICQQQIADDTTNLTES